MALWRGVLAVALLVPFCAACVGDEEEVAVGDVAACDDLRRRENELIVVINEALAALADADSDRGRADAIVAGFDELIAEARDQVATISSEPELTDALVAGAEAAVAELEDERGRFVADVDAVPASDEHGRAGQLQNALEKAFSHLEPPRAVYDEVGLSGATDTDPDCRFVTQRGDPAR